MRPVNPESAVVRLFWCLRCQLFREARRKV